MAKLQTNTPAFDERRQELMNALWPKAWAYEKKADRARTQQRADYWNARAKLIRAFMLKDVRYSIRPTTSYFGQDSPYRFRYIPKQQAAAWWVRTRTQRTLEGKEKFLGTHTYSPWFMSNSMSADYGSFDCEYCGRHFYHSPSRISKGLTLVYECCCGTCTNAIIGKDHPGAKPFVA